MPKALPRFIYLLLILIVAVFACNLPSATAVPPTIQPQSNSGNVSAASTQPPSATDTATAPPVLHQLVPSDVSPTGTLNYDVDSSGTGPEHRAPYGDAYDLNLFERPFTQSDMTYVPNLDITTFQISTDGTWYYVFIGLIGNNPNDPINIDYGVELNKNGSPVSGGKSLNHEGHASKRFAEVLREVHKAEGILRFCHLFPSCPLALVPGGFCPLC